MDLNHRPFDYQSNALPLSYISKLGRLSGLEPEYLHSQCSALTNYAIASIEIPNEFEISIQTMKDEIIEHESFAVKK